MGVSIRLYFKAQTDLLTFSESCTWPRVPPVRSVRGGSRGLGVLWALLSLHVFPQRDGADGAEAVRAGRAAPAVPVQVLVTRQVNSCFYQMLCQWPEGKS